MSQEKKRMLKTETIIVDEAGGVNLPTWVFTALLKKSGVRSKKKRIQRKIIKRALVRLIEEAIRDLRISLP